GKACSKVRMTREQPKTRSRNLKRPRQGARSESRLRIAFASPPNERYTFGTMSSQDRILSRMGSRTAKALLAGLVRRLHGLLRPQAQ
ncbi:MAG: hypothetical protein VYB82_04950, partial [Pseudomonadota bacterium]|nr:hypothetical protein [Pseudomonadota bacterium]